jgi:hypothetical protein
LAIRREQLRQAIKKAIHDPEVIKVGKKMDKPINYISYEVSEKWIEASLNCLRM